MDGIGGTIKVETGDNATGTVISRVDTTYAPCACSPMGKVATVSQPYKPGDPVYQTSYTYDGMGRTLTISMPAGDGTTTYSYAGNTTTVTDPAGKWKKYTTNGLGQLVKVTEPSATPGDPDQQWDTSYTYDAMDHLTQVSMTRVTLLSPVVRTTQTRTFNYDAATQRLTSATNPENGAVTYTYNSDGTLASKTDANNQKVTYTYDFLGRLLRVERYPQAGGQPDPCQTVTYTYDQQEMPGGAAYQIGRLSGTHWGNSNGSCTGNPFGVDELYLYTIPGRIQAKELKLTSTFGKTTVSGALDASYYYDAEGRLTTYYLPNSGTVAYTNIYDNLGRASKLMKQIWPNPAQELVNNVDYGAAGQLKQVSYGGYTETRQYNARVQLTRLQANGSGLPSVDLTYSYSSNQNNGRTTQMQDNVSGETITYQYDAVNRLISATATGSQPWSYAYAYDAFGNRTQQGGSSWSYDASTNWLTGTGYQYDNNGNLTATATDTYTYDVENRLTAAGSETYAYNAANERVCKNGCQELHFYGAFGELLGTYQPNISQQIWFSTLTQNLYFAGRMVQAQGNWLVMDRLGSVRANSAGQTFNYYPYGEERPSATTQNRHKFGTYYRDSTGLDYAYQRYYSSIMGRFLTPDPSGEAWDITNPQSWNSYSYVGNDPVNLNDPTGLVQCGDLNVLGGGRVRDYLNAGGNAGKLTRFVWAEGGTLTQSGGNRNAWTTSMTLIAQAIINRVDIANGRVAVVGVDGQIYWGNGGTFSGTQTLQAHSAKRKESSDCLAVGTKRLKCVRKAVLEHLCFRSTGIKILIGLCSGCARQRASTRVNLSKC